MNEQKAVLDISWATIFKIFAAVLLFYLVFVAKDILVWFVFALAISILFDPIISFLQKIKIPRFLSVIFIYVAVFGLFSLTVYFIAPIFISEIKNFSQVFPKYLSTLFPVLKEIGFWSFGNIESFVNVLKETLEKSSASIFDILVGFFGGIFSTIFILTVAVFISLEEKSVESTVAIFFPKKYENFILALWTKCRKKVTGWFWIRALACFFVGLSSYFVFLLFNLEYPFSLALFAGVFNFIPYIGPSLVGFLLFLIVASEGTMKAIFVLIVFALIQQIENNIISPLLSKKIIGLSPVLVLISLALGGRLWGIMGAILAVPLCGILFEFLKDYLSKRREKELPAP